MPQDTQPGDLHKLARVVEFKFPVTWLLSVVGAFAVTFGSMFFQIGQVNKELTELKLEVKSGNAQQTLVSSEVAILRFRVEQIEKERK